jgi:hypothetical protein
MKAVMNSYSSLATKLRDDSHAARHQAPVLMHQNPYDVTPDTRVPWFVRSNESRDEQL